MAAAGLAVSGALGNGASAKAQGLAPNALVINPIPGFQLSPYADVTPAGEPAKDVARRLWHRSPGSPG